jgi:ankyrin repeat protein
LVVRLAINLDFPINDKEELEETLLMIAIRRGLPLDIIEYFAHHEKKIDTVDCFGNTALMLAASSGLSCSTKGHCGTPEGQPHYILA